MEYDILKEYLVKIGIDIPMSEIQKFNAHMEAFDKGIFGLIKRLNNLLSGWKAVALAYAGLAKKITSFTIDVAKADLETQKWAKHMYLTNDSAKILSRTLDSMDLQFGDLQDVALNPELFNQYKELVRLGKELQGGPEIEQSLRKVRAFNFEFTKLRMTLSYLSERIAHYVSKILDSPAGQAMVNGIKNLNSFLKNNIDSIARKIASFINVIMRTVLRVSQLIRGWVELFRNAYNWLESRLKNLGNVLVGVISVVGAALLLSPIGKLILLFQGIMLLIDDYMTYQEGGLYLIPWEKLEVIWEEIKKFLIEFVNALIYVLKEMKNVFGITEKAPDEVYRPGLVESIFRLPAEGLGRLVLPKEDFEELKRRSPSYWDQKPIESPTLSFNVNFKGDTFTREDIQLALNNATLIRGNQGSIV